MKFCGKCGNQVALTQKFCNKCGTPNPYYTVPAPSSEPVVNKPEDEKERLMRELRERQLELDRIEREAAQEAERRKEEERLRLADEQRRRQQDEEQRKRQQEETERYERELLAVQKAKLEQLAADRAAKEQEEIRLLEEQKKKREQSELDSISSAKQKLLQELEELESLKRKRDSLLAAPPLAVPENVAIPEPARSRSRAWVWILVGLFIVCGGGGFAYYHYVVVPASAAVQPLASALPAPADSVVRPIQVDTVRPAAAAAPSDPRPQKSEDKTSTVKKAPEPVKKETVSNGEVSDALIKKDLIGKRLSARWTFDNPGQILTFSKSAPKKISETEVQYQLYMTLEASTGTKYTCKASVTYARVGAGWQMAGSPVQNFLDEKQ